MLSLMPIGHVRSTRIEICDDAWDKERAHVELDGLGAEALIGLDTFSHVEIVFLMHRVELTSVETSARHPRNDTTLPKVGILAQRAKNRPNRIGTTVCRVLRVEGTCLHVQGLDAVDGTPVLDIKPWVQELGPRGDVHQPAWMTDLMRRYWA